MKHAGLFLGNVFKRCGKEGFFFLNALELVLLISFFFFFFFNVSAVCSYGVCFNGGHCREGPSQLCDCPAGFSGPSCQYGELERLIWNSASFSFLFHHYHFIEVDKDVYRFYLIKMIILDLNFSPATVVYVQ